MSSPDQAALDSALRDASRVRVAQVQVAGGAQLLDVKEPAELGEFATLLRIAPGPPFHCMCPGDEDIEFYSGEKMLCRVTLHHGRSIRWEPEWDSDALLEDGPALLRWMAEHGAEGPLARWEQDQRRMEAGRDSSLVWHAAMPEALASMVDGLSGLPVNPEFPSAEVFQAERLLREARGSDEAMAGDLLAWFGSGEGPWSGFPSYENVAEALLLRLPTEAVVKVVSGEPSVPQLEGAARLVSSWWFDRMRPGEAGRLPGEVRRRLRRHVAASADPDKIARLEGALGDEHDG
jgi:hypothetical protein